MAEAVGKVKAAMLAKFEEARWQPFFDLLGLQNNNRDNFARLLIMHMLLDRFLAMVLTETLVEGRTKDSTALREIFHEVAGLNMAKRVMLALKLGAISNTTAKYIREINELRNSFVHYKPKRGWGLDHLPEIANQEAFDRCAKKGWKALDDLMSRYMPKDATKE